MKKPTKPRPSAAALAQARHAGLAYLAKNYPRYRRLHEDLVQDAFVKLLEQGETNPAPAHLIAFLHNVARSHVKRADTKRTVFTKDLAPWRDDA